MSPEKTSPSGRYRLDIEIPGVGRLRNATSRKLAVHRRCVSVVYKLAEAGRLDELLALTKEAADGGVTPLQLLNADRRNARVTDPKRVQLALPVLAAAEQYFDKKDPTERRYQISLKQLANAEVIAERTRISDLAKIDWAALDPQWTNSAADWNHIRRAVSRLLTVTLGMEHPVRRGILDRFPTRDELERYVELTPEEFGALIAPAPTALQDCFWTLAGTGMRSESEFVRLTRAMLGHLVVHIRFTKTPKGHRNIPVDQEIWPHVLRSVPCAFKPRYLADRWTELATAAGRPELLLRDLRHLFCIWALESGAMDVGQLRDAAGHRNLATTQKYIRKRATRESAAVLARFMKPKQPGVPQSAPQPRRKRA